MIECGRVHRVRVTRRKGSSKTVEDAFAEEKGAVFGVGEIVHEIDEQDEPLTNLLCVAALHCWPFLLARFRTYGKEGACV